MRWFLKFLLSCLVVALLVVVAGGFFLFEDQPRLPAMAPPSPEDVAATRAFVHQVREATGAAPDRDRQVSLPVDELRGAMRLGLRLVPSLRADAEIAGEVVRCSVSLPLPLPGGAKWLNAVVEIPQFDQRTSLARLEVGGRPLPRELSLRLAQFATNLLLGNRAGDTIVGSASQLRIEEETLIFTLDLDRDGRGQVIRGVFAMLRDDAMPAPAEIDEYYVKIRRGMDAGILADTGSFVPYLRFALESAHAAGSAGDLANAYTAAMFALTKACGARDFTLVVGRLAGDRLDRFGSWQTDCSKVTLAGRIDTRRHFITAAAIKAASNRGVAISIGEFKELHDSLSADSGFDFTDIAANNSGIRMSDFLMAQPAEAWPGILVRITAESDILPDFAEIPAIMPRAEFEASYRDVNSVAYHEELAAIEGMIDRVGLYGRGGLSGNSVVE